MKNKILPFTYTLLICGFCDAKIDNNANGLCDIWELKYNITSLTDQSVTSDLDDDGLTLAEEELAGTDPNDRDSRLAVFEIINTGTELNYVIQTSPGKLYQPYYSNDLSEWIAVGDAFTTDETSYSFVGDQDVEKGFYKFQALDVDTDGDGLSDWVEKQFSGFSTTNDDSFSVGSINSDYDRMDAQLETIRNSEVRIFALGDDLYESNHTTRQKVELVCPS